ncbi:MAG: DUF177 domain-containing protein [Nitrospinota bacterium]
MSGSQWAVSIDEIPEEGLSLKLSEAPAFFDFEREGCAWRGPVEWTGTLQRFGADVLCRGKVKARALLPCSRCLREVEVDLEGDLTFTFAPQRLAEAKKEKEKEEEGDVGSEEPDLYPYQEGRLNLRDPTRDNMIMAIPLQPLCRQDCKGLCSSCGADLNEGRCGCAREAYDPRWEALARLRSAFPSQKS